MRRGRKKKKIKMRVLVECAVMNRRTLNIFLYGVGGNFKKQIYEF